MRSVAWSQSRAGHQSAATYSHAFKEFTGTSPSRFRREVPRIAEAVKQLAAAPRTRVVVHRSSGCDPVPQAHPLTIRVTNQHSPSILFVALHTEALLRVAPFLGLALLGTDRVVVDAIPDGEYVAMVVEAPLSGNPRRLFHLDRNQRAIRLEPIRFPLEAPTEVELALRPLEPSDPPITPTLPRLLVDALRRERPDEGP